MTGRLDPATLLTGMPPGSMPSDERVGEGRAFSASDVLVTATISVTTLAASGNPLLNLPTEQALVFLAKARGLCMGSVAVALRISEKTAYRYLHRARTALETAVAHR